jgi:hypothetical protein
VIVVAPPTTTPLPPSQSFPSMPLTSVPRHFTVIGDDSLDSHSE